MNLIYTRPTLKEARKWNQEHREDSVSAFACQYPGHYAEAAEALREVRGIK